MDPTSASATSPALPSPTPPSPPPQPSQPSHPSPTSPTSPPSPPPPPPQLLRPDRIELYRNGYATIHHRAAVSGRATLALHIPYANFSLSIRSLVVTDSRGPRPTLSFPSPHATDNRHHPHRFLSRQLGADITLSHSPLNPPSQSTPSNPSPSSAPPPTHGTLLAVSTQRDQPTAFVATPEGPVVARPLSPRTALAVASSDPQSTFALSAPRPTPPQASLRVHVLAEACGDGHVQLSYDTLSPLDPSFDVHYHVDASSAALSSRDPHAHARCVALVANPLPFALTDIALVLRDSHYRHDVAQALRHDAPDVGAQSIRSDASSSVRSRSTSSRSPSRSSDDSDSDAPASAEENDDAVASMLSASVTDGAAFNYTPNFVHETDGRFDLPVGGAVSVPLFDTHCEIRLIHGCSLSDSALMPCLAVKNNSDRLLESGTMHCYIAGRAETFALRKTLTTRDDESYYRTSAPSTVAMDKTVSSRGGVRSLKRAPGGDVLVRQACERVTRFDLRNRRNVDEEVVIAIKSRRYEEDDVWTDARVYNSPDDVGREGVSFAEPEVLKPIVNQEYFSIRLGPMGRKTFVVTQRYFLEKSLGLPWNMSGGSLPKLLESEEVEDAVKEKLKALADSALELEGLRRKRRLYRLKLTSLKMYAKVKARDSVSSEDEDYDDEAGADGMSGMVQRFVRINETVERGMMWVLEEKDKIETKITEAKEGMRAITEEIEAML